MDAVATRSLALGQDVKPIVGIINSSNEGVFNTKEKRVRRTAPSNEIG